MGEIAEMMLDGTLCEGCGEYLGSDLGIPMRCASCAKEWRAERHQEVLARHHQIKKAACPTCGKRVKLIGLADHQRDAHGESKQVTPDVHTKEGKAMQDGGVPLDSKASDQPATKE